MNTFSLRTATVVKAALGVLILIGAVSVTLADDGHNHDQDGYSHEQGDGHNHGQKNGHPTKGPRGGALIELGNEELHAELLHDDETGTVTVFMLDAEAKRYVSVTSTEFVIQVRHEEQAEQFRLKAKPQKGDRQGTTSCFMIRNPKLVTLLDDHHSEARMGIKIGERSFVGRIAHVHDHEHGDAHAH